MSEEHYCIIGKLKLVQIPGAKTLQLGYYEGLPYAVGKNITENDLVAIFLPDGQISEEFATRNDLFERKDPVTGHRAGGFFGSNRKVRSIKLMGGKITSVGFVAELSCFDYTGWKDFKEGFSFNSLGDKPICNKFVTEASKKAAVNTRDRRQERRRSITKVIFPQHQKTNQFMRNSERALEDGDLVYLTYKLDGTSVRIGNVYENLHWPWWKRILDKIIPLGKMKLTHITGTRTVNLRTENSQTYYGNNSIYTEFGESLRGMLNPGEIIYGEIVGWLDAERPLFNRGGMYMKYGCPPGVRKMYVYNIKWTLPNKQEIDLPWPKIKQRCLELGLETVPEIDELIWTSGFPHPHYWKSGMPWNWSFIKQLEKFLVSASEGPDILDDSHIKEGICIRIEKPNGTVILKYKSPDFYALEDKSKNEGVEDIEEVQSEILEEDQMQEL